MTQAELHKAKHYIFNNITGYETNLATKNIILQVPRTITWKNLFLSIQLSSYYSIAYKRRNAKTPKRYNFINPIILRKFGCETSEAQSGSMKQNNSVSTHAHVADSVRKSTIKD